jgi:oxygen-dependent protoporphyrinogen oxidase
MVGIIGGGISGLSLSYYLRRKGIEHVVLESAAVPGGVMRTEEAGGVPLDLGPQRVRLTAPLREMVESLGLAGDLLAAPERLPLWVYRRGRLRRVPFSWREAIVTDLVGWRGKLRVLLEPITGGPRAEESVEDFFVRKFGREAYEAFLGPLYGGLYASDPARMKARHGLTATLRDFGVEGSLLIAAARRGLGAREGVPTVTFRGGLGTLPKALAAAGGRTVRLGTPVESLEREASRWRMQLGGSGRGECLFVDQVVLALPAPAASRLLARCAPDAAGSLARLRYNPLAVVHLQSSCTLTGFGYQVAFGEAMETRGVTWNASMFGRDGVYTAYLGGMANPALVEWEDERIASVARREFETATGCGSRSLLVSRTSVPAWDESWDALATLVLPEGVHACANWSARPGIPGRLAQAHLLAAGFGRQD